MVHVDMQEEINCQNCTAGTDDWMPMKRTGGSSSGGLSYHPDVTSFAIAYTCKRCLEEVHCYFAFGIETVMLATRGARKIDSKS